LTSAPKFVAMESIEYTNYLIRYRQIKNSGYPGNSNYPEVNCGSGLPPRNKMIAAASRSHKQEGPITA
jgi:hypothetical protein